MNKYDIDVRYTFMARHDRAADKIMYAAVDAGQRAIRNFRDASLAATGYGRVTTDGDTLRSKAGTREEPLPLLPEGDYVMRVTEVARQLSKVTGDPLWRVILHPIDLPHREVAIFYSEKREGMWKIEQDAGSVEDLPAMLGERYTVNVTHDVYRGQPRERAEIIHDEPQPEIVVTITSDKVAYNMRGVTALPSGAYEARLIVKDETDAD